MALLGHFQKLQAVKITPQGFYLSDNQEEEYYCPTNLFLKIFLWAMR